MLSQVDNPAQIPAIKRQRGGKILMFVNNDYNCPGAIEIRARGELERPAPLWAHIRKPRSGELTRDCGDTQHPGKIARRGIVGGKIPRLGEDFFVGPSTAVRGIQKYSPWKKGTPITTTFRIGIQIPGSGGRSYILPFKATPMSIWPITTTPF